MAWGVTIRRHDAGSSKLEFCGPHEVVQMEDGRWSCPEWMGEGIEPQTVPLNGWVKGRNRSDSGTSSLAVLDTDDDRMVVVFENSDLMQAFMNGLFCGWISAAHKYRQALIFASPSRN